MKAEDIKVGMKFRCISDEHQNFTKGKLYNLYSIIYDTDGESNLAFVFIDDDRAAYYRWYVNDTRMHIYYLFKYFELVNKTEEE